MHPITITENENIYSITVMVKVITKLLKSLTQQGAVYVKQNRPVGVEPQSHLFIPPEAYIAY